MSRRHGIGIVRKPWTDTMRVRRLGQERSCERVAGWRIHGCLQPDVH